MGEELDLWKLTKVYSSILFIALCIMISSFLLLAGVIDFLTKNHRPSNLHEYNYNVEVNKIYHF
jgi:hypothetical protein